MRYTVACICLGLAAVLGCARVRVEAPKEPIKVDISMRLDIYQHIEKDISAIEDIVAGSPAPAKNNQSLYFGLISLAYAQESLSPEVEAAALKRRDRKQSLSSWEAKGVVGETKAGLVEIRKQEGADGSVAELVRAENADRMVIYRAVAQKNGSSVEEVQKLYAKRLQDDAPAGTPIESADGAWRTK